MTGAVFDRLRVFSLRELAVHRARTAASVTVVAVSAAFLVAVFGISGSVTGSIRGLADGLAGNATLEVSGVTDAGFPESLRADIAAVPGVSAAAPMLQASTPTDRGPVLLLGADEKSAVLDSALKSAVTDKISALMSVPNGVLVGPGTGYAEHETFRLGAGRATVAAVLHGGELARLNDGHYVFAPLPLAQRLADRQGQLDSVLVVPRADAEPAAVRAGVRAAVAGRALVGDPSLKAVRDGNGVVIMQAMTLLGASVAFVVAAFLIYTAMSMAIAQRRPVISMLRAVGGRRSTLVADLLAEAAVLGLVGGALGGLLGILMGRLAIDSLPAAMVQTMQARMVYMLPWYAIPVAVAAAVVTSVAASAVAARQVYKVSPIEALAPVGVSAADEVRPAVRVVAAVAAVGLAVAALLGTRAHLGLMSVGVLALAFTAEILLCFAGATAIVRAAARTARRFGSPGALAAATIERAPRRIWATLMTVSIAVSMTISITGSNTNSVDSAQSSFQSLATADVWVAAQPPDRFPTGPLLPPGLKERVAAVPGVATVNLGQVGFAAVGGTKVIVFGIGEGARSPLYNNASPQVKQAINTGSGVALSRDLARSLHVSAGERIELQTPSGVRHATVAGVVSYFSAISGSMAMNVEQMRAWYQRPGGTIMQVAAQPGADVPKLIEHIRAAAPPDVHVYSGRESLEGVNGAIRQGMNLSNAIWVIVAFIAAVALLNTLTLSVLERRRELGVLRAMGSSRRFALRMILAEAAAIGIVGAVVGAIFGLLSQFLSSLVMPEVMSIDVAFRPTPEVAMFAVGALVLALAGAVPPAVRAARLNIVEAVAIE